MRSAYAESNINASISAHFAKRNPWAARVRKIDYSYWEAWIGWGIWTKAIRVFVLILKIRLDVSWTIFLAVVGRRTFTRLMRGGERQENFQELDDAGFSVFLGINRTALIDSGQNFVRYRAVWQAVMADHFYSYKYLRHVGPPNRKCCRA